MNDQRIPFLVATLILLSCYSWSQPFTDSNAGLAGAGRSSVGFCDYDNDGDLDILITGNQGSGPYLAVIYRNDNGVYTEINSGLTGIDNSSVAWGDYDNDGDMDILATGRSSGSTKTWLYRNDSGIFTSIESLFPNVGSYGAVAWGDIDGDADLDAVISGNYETHIFQNNGGEFTCLNITLPAVSNSYVNVGDFDNDGDQDLFVMGDVGGWPVSAICRNDGFAFTELDSTGIVPLSSGSSSWNDYDQDQDLDLLISGFDQYLEPKTYIFRNEGGLNFTDIRADLVGSALGASAWGDYDNDGDADALVTGQNAACGSLSSILYQNNGDDIFSDINAPFIGTERGSANWGDYDNDGDLDLLIAGFDGSGKAVSTLYTNTLGSNTFSDVENPSIPDGLNSMISGNSVTLNWYKSYDNSTPQTGITYNLRIGVTSGGQEILPANADASGFHLIPQPGNIGADTAWTLNLVDGDYYWSVQSLDHGFESSPFSEEHQFSIGQVGLSDKKSIPGIVIAPNPFSDFLKIETQNPGTVEIMDGIGRPVLSTVITKECLIDTHSWPSGVYFVGTPDRLNHTKTIAIKK